MDLQQNKLTKAEWESIEIPSTDDEKNILKLIIKGFHDVNIKENNTLSILSYLKLSNVSHINDYIFTKYLQPEIIRIYKKYKITYKPLNLNNKTLNKADKIRFDHMERNLLDRKNSIFEFILIDYIENILKYKDTDTKWIKSFYTLKNLLKYNIHNVNKYLLDVINLIIELF